MSWFKIYQEWYNREIIQLSSDSIYKERFRLTKRLLVSCGEIIVRTKSIKRFPILFVYPESTPYTLPKAFLLESVPHKEIVENISFKSELEICEQIKDLVNIVYLRHQNSDGSICIVEQDNLYSDSPQIYPISDIIKRIRDWLISLETGKITFDTIEVEPYAHFPNKYVKIQFLIPEIFFDDNIVQGEFLFHIIPHSYQFEVSVLIGAKLIGQNSNGLSIHPKYNESSCVLFAPNIDPMDILLDDRKITEKIKNDEIITGSWWDIDSEPKPFGATIEIASLIGNGNVEEGFQKIFSSKLFDCLRSYEEKCYIGIRFYNRRKKLEWLFFILNKVGKSPFSLPASVSDISTMLENYSIKAIYSEEFTDSSHHIRNSGSTSRNILKEKEVSIVGLGALGSEIADCLSKAGINKLTLVDNQLFHAHNSIRHLIGLDRVGFPKTLGAWERIYLHNPFVEIAWFADLDVLKTNINKFIDVGSIGISSIADDNVESYLNERAIIDNKTIFYSRVLRGGKCARIIRVVPLKDACLNCLRIYREEENPLFINIPVDDELPTISTECNNPIRPASAADIKLAAAITSRILINFLQGEKISFNHWIFSSEDLPSIQNKSLFPFYVYESYIPPHPSCHLCRTKEKTSILISSSAYSFMIEEVSNSGNSETGGILIGRQLNEKQVYVSKATGPGPNATRKPNYFERDVEYCQSILNEEFEKHGNDSIYIGEWHYHPINSNNPSSLDLTSLSEISRSPDYLVNQPIMLIFSITKGLSCTVHPNNGSYYSTNFELVEGK